MGVTYGKLSAPEDRSLIRFCPLLVTLHPHLKEAAGTPDGLQTLNLDKPSQCCLKAFFSCLFLTTFHHMKDTLWWVQSAPAPSVPEPRSSCHLLAADRWWGGAAMQSCRAAQRPWGQAITTLKGKLTPADSTTALHPFPGYCHAQAKVVLCVPFPFPLFVFFFKARSPAAPLQSDSSCPAQTLMWLRKLKAW